MIDTHKLDRILLDLSDVCREDRSHSEGFVELFQRVEDNYEYDVAKEYEAELIYLGVAAYRPGKDYQYAGFGTHYILDITELGKKVCAAGGVDAYQRKLKEETERKHYNVSGTNIVIGNSISNSTLNQSSLSNNKKIRATKKASAVKQSTQSPVVLILKWVIGGLTTITTIGAFVYAALDFHGCGK